MAPRLRTGIGRPIDLRYPSNRFVVMIAPLAGAAAGLITLVATDDGFFESVRNGLLGGAAAFLAWAIGREIEPDRPLAANLAAVAAPTALLAGDPALGQLAAILLAGRILVRSTGRAPELVDLVVVGGLATYVATTDGGLPVGLMLAAAVAADVGLPGGAPQRSAIAALVSAAAAVAAAIATGRIRIDPLGPNGSEWILVAVAGMGLLLLARPDAVLSRPDRGDQPISPRRLRAARIVAVGAGAGAFIWVGGSALAATAGAWAALAAAFWVSVVARRPSDR